MPKTLFDALVAHLWKQTVQGRRSGGRRLHRERRANTIFLMVSIVALLFLCLTDPCQVVTKGVVTVEDARELFNM
jgi:hypothetical protein